MDRNMSEDDNKQRENSGLMQDSNMNHDTESAKRLKTESGSLGIENTVDYTSNKNCNYLDNSESSSTSNIEVNTNAGNIINSQNQPLANLESVDSVLGEFRSVTSEEGSSLSSSYDNPASPQLDSDDDELEPATSLLENENEAAEEEHPVLKKTKPRHNWFILSEIANRQFGYSSKKKGAELFQRRCYGSLHCAQRLELLYKLDKHDGCVNSINFNPSGTLLASGSDDLNVIIWDWKVGKALLHYDTKHRSNVLQSKFLDLSGDLQIATCARDGQVRLSQVSVQEGLRSNRKLGFHKGACHKLAVLHGQPHVILSAGEDGIVYHYDIRDFRPDKMLSVTSNNAEVIALYSINSNPLNSYEFCVSGRDYMIRSYDQRKCGGSAKPLNTYYPKGQWAVDDDSTLLHVTSAVYSHNGSEILASYNDDDIYLFDTNGTPGSFVHWYQGHRNGATIKGVNFFGPKSEFVISGSDCGNVYIWEKNTEAIVNWMVADDNGVTNCLEPHPQLPFLCTSGLDWDIKVWIPSCENEPPMMGLGKTVQSNKKSRSELFRNGIGENRILWMLFRHFRNQNRNINFEDQSTHSSRSSSNSDSNSDALEGVSDCSPS